GAGIHNLDNVMALDHSVHCLLDQATSMENTYTVRATKETFCFCKANPITFKSPDLPLRNPTHLKIHAACCTVAHLSGAGEYTDKILEDLEDMRVLSKDGSSDRKCALERTAS
ncbi:hypothetical protein F5148DRAFT_981816, partial [Russula earlei]